jgi:molybdenum cofactor synthesis domain-containing protein
MATPKPTFKIGFLASGTELTTGDTINTNSPAMARMLAQRGAEIGQHLLCPDHPTALEGALRYLMQDHHAILMLGGLGPTSDDWTREILGRLSPPLHFHEPAWNAMVTRFHRRYPHLMSMPETNRRQAYFPHHSQYFENPHGSAWGFYLNCEGRDVFALPGPPHECLPMFEDYVLPFLEERGYFSDCMLHLWRVTGISEALIAEQLDAVTQPYGIPLGYRAHSPFVDIKLWISASHPSLPTLLAAIQSIVAPYQVLDPEIALS